MKNVLLLITFCFEECKLFILIDEKKSYLKLNILFYAMKTQNKIIINN